MRQLWPIAASVRLVRLRGFHWRWFSSSAVQLSPSKDDIDRMVRSDKVVVFMKGSPEAPQCGFSNLVCQILRLHNVEFKHYDVLQDDQLRADIKHYSDWSTVPQVFIGGEFVGGSDILKDLHSSGELKERLRNVGIRST